ncbi:MAG: LPS export ABC transporter periplasmic protein LptC [Proteobacteria bacterium]|nr:LPS export ABC transporter periplasmic protein LptC [Pseudomonadota bacterium]
MSEFENENKEKEEWFSPATRMFSAKSLKRYSRFVGGMKLLLPLLAVGLVVALMAWPSDIPPPAPPRQATAGDSTMQAPVYTSVDKQGRPYRVQAEGAKQNPTAPNVMDLANPKGTIDLSGGNSLQGQATGAEYDQKTGKMLINGSLTLKHSSGAVFTTEKAVVDMNARSASGNSPVKVTGDFGEVNAQGFEMNDEGKVVIFKGPSTAHLNLTASQNPASAMQDLFPAATAPAAKPPGS